MQGLYDGVYPGGRRRRQQRRTEELLCGGQQSTHNWLTQTPVSEIEEAFTDFTKERKDIAIVLISQYVADKIRPLVDRYAQAFPALLEIPSKDHPYGRCAPDSSTHTRSVQGWRSETCAKGTSIRFAHTSSLPSNCSAYSYT